PTYREDLGNNTRNRFLRHFLIYHGGATVRNVREMVIDDSAIYTDPWPGSKNPNTARWKIGPSYYMRADIYGEGVPSAVYDTSFSDTQQGKNLRSRPYYCNWYMRNFSPSRADLYVSLHSDADGPLVRGTSTLYADDSAASFTDYDNTKYTVDSSIRHQCLLLAQNIQSRVVQVMRDPGGFNDPTWVDRGLFIRNELVETSRPRVPSCLIEVAFHTSTGPPITNDYWALVTSTGQRWIAQGIYKGICDYYGVEYNIPAKITDLTVDLNTGTTYTIQLTWTAPGEVGLTYDFSLMPVSNYLVKYSSYPITAANWNAPNTLTALQSWTPSAPGTKEGKTINVRDNENYKYVQIRSLNSIGDMSKLSNVTYIWRYYKTTLSGYVKDATDNLLTGAVCKLTPGDYTVTADTSGYYCFILTNIEPGMYTLTVSSRGFVPSTYYVDLPREGSVVQNAVLVVGARIYGIVTDASRGSVPLQAVNCKLKGQNNLEMQTETDTNGKYEFDGLSEGTYNLTFTKGGYNEYKKQITLTTGQHYKLDIRLTLKAALEEVKIDNKVFTPRGLTRNVVKLNFNISPGAKPTVKIFNIRGRQVREIDVGDTNLVNIQDAYATFKWDGKDEQGRELPAGVYFYQIEVDGKMQTGKTVLAK
ncbi:MAG: carboxypeptidase regulatory-like domain-containing protein, partial [Elusimicrobiota bacterium]|nr:carboxypeptidase regulatory-like domain-containing protein [Elusimicrobiota bacterium]